MNNMTDYALPQGPARHDAVFVVRIWWEKRNQGAQPLWRGYVQHAQSNQSAYFCGFEELVAFIQRWAGAQSVPTCPK